jgi:iron complex outermembrane receptor protein
MDVLASIDPTSITGEAITRNGIDSLNLGARQSILSRAVYGQATFPLGSEKDHLTLGIRYTNDRVHGAGEQYVIDSATGKRRFIADHIDDVSKFDQITYKIAFDHQIGDEIIAYGWYSRGFKSGTYNLLPLELPALNPEKVDAFELGMKAALLGGRLRINLAAFHNKVSDPQVQIVKTVGGVATNQYVNAERARSRGVDFSVRFGPSPGLVLRMTGQYLDSRFVRFRNAPSNAPNFAPPYGVTTSSGDAGGNRTPNSPGSKLNAGFTYRFDAGSAGMTIDGNIAYRGSFKWEPDNFITEPALTLLNASVTIEPENMPGWSVRVWGNNLTNQKYLGNMLTQSGPVGFMASPAEPRTFGLAIRYRL